MKNNSRSSVITILSLAGFFGIFSTTISKNPVLSLYVKSLNSSEAVLGLIASISPLAGILFSFPVGILADRLGKKKLLLISALVFTIAPILYIAVGNPFWLIPIRFFHGISTAILGPVASAVIFGAYPDSKGEKLGLYSSATLIGRTLAPLIGGAVISCFVFLGNGWNYKMVYLTAFLVSLPILFLILALENDNDGEKPKKVTLKDFSESLKDIGRQPKILATGFVEMATYFTFGTFETYLPVLLNQKGIPAYQTGIIFSLQIMAIAITKPLFGKLSDSIDRRLQIVIGIMVLGISMPLIPFIPGIIPLALTGIVFGIGMSLSTVATSTYVADVSKKEKLGTSLGALSSIMDIGHSGGPLITGMVITALSFQAGFLACLLVCILSALYFIIQTGNHPGKSKVVRGKM